MALFYGILVLAFFVPGGCSASVKNAVETEAEIDFDAFVAHHKRKYAKDSEEFGMRKGIFERTKDWVARHNNKEHRTWTAKVNKFSDRTHEELARLRGWKGKARPGHSAAPKDAGSSARFITTNATVMQHPNEFNWTHLTSVKDIQDQGGCGSCWAFASAAVLRAHSEIWMKDSRKFSVQQIISCTANPLECGGTGGCKGATAELAMDYVYQYGCRTEEEMPYAETESQCPHSLVEGDALATKKAENTLGMIGWTKLPENKLDPLKTALVQKGPVAVSISAAYSFNQYGGGVLDNCPQDATIDHAVALVGYGETTAVTASAALGGITTPSLKYWLLQNSWGTDWGEQGFIRMVRKDGQEESYCGWDNEPEIGSGCLGGPPKVWVCGTCGLLYDTVIPHFEDKSRLSTPKPLAARQSSFLQRNDPPMQQPPAFW